MVIYEDSNLKLHFQSSHCSLVFWEAWRLIGQGLLDHLIKKEGRIRTDAHPREVALTAELLPFPPRPFQRICTRYTIVSRRILR